MFLRNRSSTDTRWSILDSIDRYASASSRKGTQPIPLSPRRPKVIPFADMSINIDDLHSRQPIFCRSGTIQSYCLLHSPTPKTMIINTITSFTTSLAVQILASRH